MTLEIMSELSELNLSAETMSALKDEHFWGSQKFELTKN